MNKLRLDKANNNPRKSVLHETQIGIITNKVQPFCLVNCISLLILLEK